MMGSFLTRALIMALGYAYPAYECFKTVEKNKPEIEQLRFWCQYWILVAALTVFERVGDAFISWLPMYSEAKLAFFIYLWFPKTRGTSYVYDSFLRPYIAKHESEIDRNLLELRTRAGDFIVLYWQKTATYGQTRFFEMLQYVASQSQPSRPNPQGRPQPPPRQPPPSMVPPRQPTTQQQKLQTQQQQSQPQLQPPPQSQQSTALRAPPSPMKNLTKEVKPETSASSSVQEVAPPSSTQAASSATNALLPEAAGPSKQAEPEPMQVEATSTPKTLDKSASTTDSVIEEAIRVTRARLRKTRTAPATAASSR